MELVSFITGLVALLAFFVLPDLLVLVERTEIRRPYDKSVVYLCSEYSYAPNKWESEQQKRRIEGGKSASLPFTAVVSGLFGPVGQRATTVNSIFFALIFLYLVLAAVLGVLGIKGVMGEWLGVYVYLAVLATVFLYYFRSVSSDLYVIEEQAATSAEFLLGLGWEKLSDEVLNIVQEQVKADFDLVKHPVGLGGFILVTFTSLGLVYSRLSTEVSFEVLLPIAGVLLSLMGSRWLFLSYRSKVVHIALNAVLIVRKTNALERSRDGS